MKHCDPLHTEATVDMDAQPLAGSYLSAFLTKKLSRQEFLLSLGILAVSLTGVAGFLKTLAQPHISPDPTSSFSSGSYGGTGKERSTH
jgi:hypothetical protein